MKWENLPKPWTKEQCRRRYIEGDDNIGIRPLAEISGNPKRTIEVWVRKEQWVEQKKQYRNKLRSTIQKETIEKKSKKISDELSDIVAKNYEVHKLTRDYVAKLIEARARQLAEDLRLEDSRKQLALKQHNSVEINNLSQSLKRSTDAINEITGLQYYIDINAATDKLTREGYEVIDPTTEDTDFNFMMEERKKRRVINDEEDIEECEEDEDDEDI